MKRREFIIDAAVLGAGLLAGCGKGADVGRDNVPPAPSVAVVETRSHTVPSCLHWLDSDFGETGSVDIDHAAIGGWNRPCVQDGKLLLVPTGLTGRNDDKSVLLADLGASAIEAYGVRRINNYCVAAARGFAFVGGNLNWESYVSRVDLPGNRRGRRIKPWRGHRRLAYRLRFPPVCRDLGRERPCDAFKADDVRL